jgi:catalase
MKNNQITTSAGIPVADDQNAITAGEFGPVLMQDVTLIEKLAHFNRERIPERVVHAKGTGAYGTFTLTRDMSDVTIADFLNGQGKQTEVFLRFSTVGGESGSGDAERDPRGFALKFYTKQGNHDIVGNNTPVFFIRDGHKFPDFIHTQKRDPMTNLKSPEAVWDYWSLNPEAMHQITILMSDRGVPATYRNMNGYGSHTFSMWNKEGERVWVKFHFKTKQGIKCIEESSSRDVIGQDPDHAQRDLVESIENGDFPQWAVKVQIMPEKDAETYKVNPFDVTKVWNHSDYPLIEIGTLELNRNVQNYFAETEQAAFAPSNMVSGIGASPDKMLQARLFAYQDAHRYRMGTNYNQIYVNSPHATTVQNYQRAGAMAGVIQPGSEHNGVDHAGVNYFPNSKGGPVDGVQTPEPPLRISGDASRYDRYAGNDDYNQAGDLFRIMNTDQQQQLVNNIAGGLSQCSSEVQARMLPHFKQADANYGSMVCEAIAKITGMKQAS